MEGHRVRGFVNRLPRKMFGPKWDEVTGGWTKLDNEKLHTFAPPLILR
jgi:hypothetical protein